MKLFNLRSGMLVLTASAAMGSTAFAGGSIRHALHPLANQMLEEPAAPVPAETSFAKLVTITADKEPGVVAVLYAALNTSNESIGLALGDEKAADPAQFHLLSEITSEEGVVIYRASGRDIVRIKSESFDPRIGGTLNMSFLYNAITKTYGRAHFEVTKKDDKWSLTIDIGEENPFVEDKEGRAGIQAFDKMHLHKNYKLGTAVGIRSLEVNL